MKRALLLTLACLGTAGLPAAQNYSFQVPVNESHVFIQPDGACRIQYAITFANQGDPIDVVDVGLPNKRYRLNSAEAALDGRAAASIAPSSYIETGVEVKPVEALPSGATGTLTFSILQDGMLWRDDDDKAYASVRFSPTWFGGDFTSGTTHYKVHFHFPAAMGPDEPRYHKSPPSSTWKDDTGVVYLYEYDGRPSTQSTFGVSFPAKYIASVPVYQPSVIQEPPGKLALILESLLGSIANSIPCCLFLAIGGLIALGVVSSYKRKMKYLPATIGVEGVEVKRGLTVPEVACLMELPVNKVLAAILFGLVKKGRAKVVSEKPLRVEPVEGTGDLTVYEQEFLNSIKDDKTVDQKEAEEVMVKLINRVRDAMKGFNRKKTVAYYESIIQKAWEQMKGDNWQEGFDYLLLDKESDKKMPEVLGGRTVILPGWWGNYSPGYRPASTAGGGVSIPGGDFAHHMASGIEGFANNIVGSVSSLAERVTGRTNPVPVSTGGGGRSGGGGGCACACACAGCACACAGGGR